jgi:MoxR-like ATPase
MNPQIEKTIADLRQYSEDMIIDEPAIFAAGWRNGMTHTSIKEAFIQPQFEVRKGVYKVGAISLNEVTPVAAVEKQAALYEHNETKLMMAIPKQETKVNFISSSVNEDVYIPEVDRTFVQWGEYSTVKKIIDSNMFFPLYISGMSGNGKTMMVEQACAKAKREYIRVQISPETDEDDLIGGFRLVNGETVFHKGPVIKAMERGCILLIDELDRGSNKIMCLQGVLEGKPVLIKKIGEVIRPAAGFNVIATANTKGRGSEDGRYSAANIIDEAFIERFVATIDQPYPGNTIEHKIISKHMEAFDVDDAEFCDKLIAWSQVIRKTYEADGVDEVVSTRRLCHIVKAHSIFNDRMKSIMMCISRFDDETRSAFIDLYTKIDAEPKPVELTVEDTSKVDYTPY